MTGYWLICYVVFIDHTRWLDHDDAADLDEMLAGAVELGDWK